MCAYYNEDRMYMYICIGMVVVCGGNVYNIVEPGHVQYKVTGSHCKVW